MVLNPALVDFVSLLVSWLLVAGSLAAVGLSLCELIRSFLP